MTVQELVDWCKRNNLSLDTPIALRSKDDYLLTAGNAYTDTPYFGNCREGTKWEDSIKDDNGDIDFENYPQFLILDTFKG
jgi:hypothetical protein